MSKEALDDLVEALDRGVVSCGLHEDGDTELFYIEDTADVMAGASSAITALRAENDALRQQAAADAVNINTKADWIEATINDMAATDQRHLEEINAAEAAAYERAKNALVAKHESWCRSKGRNPLDYVSPSLQAANAIHAIITPEAASALAAREAASHRAGKLEGLRDAVRIKHDASKYGDDWVGMTCAILALADRIEKGEE